MFRTYTDKMVDRQVGRNAELFAESIAELATPEERYPYLRIIVSVVEQAHPEWGSAPHKPDQVASLVREMSKGRLSKAEVADVVRVRDAERGVRYD